MAQQTAVSEVDKVEILISYDSSLKAANQKTVQIKKINIFRQH